MEKELSSVLKEISQLLQKQKVSVAVAESCTAGLIQHHLSHAEEAMNFFQGGITVYNIGQKAKHLNINPIAAEACNAVAPEIAEKMAMEVAKLFNAELGLSITGFAQPVPEEDVQDCYAWIAVAKNGKIISTEKITGNKGQDLCANQDIFAEKALAQFLSSVQ